MWSSLSWTQNPDSITTSHHFPFSKQSYFWFADSWWAWFTMSKGVVLPLPRSCSAGIKVLASRRPRLAVRTVAVLRTPWNHSFFPVSSGSFSLPGLVYSLLQYYLSISHLRTQMGQLVTETSQSDHVIFEPKLSQSVPFLPRTCVPPWFCCALDTVRKSAKRREGNCSLGHDSLQILFSGW